MKMIYQLRVNTNKKKRVVYIILSFLFLSLVIFSYTGLDQYPSGLFQVLVRPLSSIESGLSLSYISEIVTTKSALMAENELLKNLILEKDALLLNKIEIQKENARLREILGRTEKQKFLLSEVLQKPNRSPYDTLIIDVGSRNGIFTGKLVVAYGEVPLGRIIEVYEKTAVVRMFSSPGQEVPVLVGDKKIESLAIGIGGGNFRMLLPKDTPIKEGDVITLPEFSGRILGTIEKIDRSEVETFARIIFKSPVSIYDLFQVFVVLE